MDIIEEESRILVEVVLGIYAPGCSEAVTAFASNTFDYDPTNAAFMFEDLLDAYSIAVTDDWTVLTARRSGTEYRVTGYDREGNLVSELTRDDIEAIEKSDEVVREEREYMEARLASTDAVGLECSPDPLFPMISDIGMGPDGCLWVRRGQEPLPVLNVYDDSGTPAGTAYLRIDSAEDRYWNVSVQPEGILAFSENPSEGFQKVYMLEVR
jgi:hypothetical protein